MREELVTKHIMKWLVNTGWHIICYDFPQSGTGKVLHPNDHVSKTNGVLIPDIVAIKGNIAVFFENKDRYYYPDYVKQNKLIMDNAYSNDIGVLLSEYAIDSIYYGIGLPSDRHQKGSIEAAHLVDFVVCVAENGTVEVPYNPRNIFS